MASSILKKPCCKCKKGCGILTCDGCHQSFCTKHIADHRHELSIEMDKIGQEYDLLRRDLIHDDNESHPALHRINIWEEESIRKIQQIAKQVRDELQQYLNEHKSQIKNLCNKLTDELYTCRESGDYTEIDLKLWIEQLTELRKTLEKSPIIDIINDNKTLIPIQMIKIKDKPNKQQSIDHNILTSGLSNISETLMFNTFVGDAIFSDNYLVAKHSGNGQKSTMVYITQSYSSGIHRLRFRIEEKSNKYLLFGIVNSFEEMNRAIYNSPSLYGWMAPDIRVVQSRKILSIDRDGRFDRNDEISLILDCTALKISLEHNQTNPTDQLSIDYRLCPLPWRVVIAFFNRNDSVRIIQ